MVQVSIRTLQARGYKVTRPRKEVLAVLERAERPLSPYDIQSILDKQDKHLNHVTIYRILDLFCRLNLAHKLPLSGGFIKCSLGEKKGCHRFMVCRQCGAIQEFADEALCHEESRIARNFNFHTEHHFSESLGLCSNCYKENES